MSRTITVAIDPEQHGGAEPESEVARIVWETIDTAWNLLREGAVRTTMVALREANPELPSDEELFREAAESGVPGAPTSYLDLAPNRGDGFEIGLASKAVRSVFEVLAERTMSDAIHGLGLDGEECDDCDHS